MPMLNLPASTNIIHSKFTAMAINPPSRHSPDFEPPEEKPHPYKKRGPTESGELKFNRDRKQGDNTIYARIDMPGVPEGSVIIFKDSAGKMVRFMGIAPVLWPRFESCTRTYVGCVGIDEDIDVKVLKIDESIVNGCFTMFLSPFYRCSLSCHEYQEYVDCKRDHHHNNRHHDDHMVEVVEGLEHMHTTIIEHAIQDPSRIKLRGGRHEHINKYLARGLKGAYEDKIIKVNNVDYLYVRVDVPTVSWKRCLIKEIDNKTFIFMANNVNELSKGIQRDSSDDRTRCYMGSLFVNCKCCLYEIVLHDFRDGVIRFLARRISKATSSIIPSTNIHYCDRPSKIGEPPKPKSIRGLKVRNYK